MTSLKLIPWENPSSLNENLSSLDHHDHPEPLKGLLFPAFSGSPKTGRQTPWRQMTGAAAPRTGYLSESLLGQDRASGDTAWLRTMQAQSKDSALDSFGLPTFSSFFSHLSAFVPFFCFLAGWALQSHRSDEGLTLGRKLSTVSHQLVYLLLVRLLDRFDQIQEVFFFSSFLGVICVFFLIISGVEFYQNFLHLSIFLYDFSLFLCC